MLRGDPPARSPHRVEPTLFGRNFAVDNRHAILPQYFLIPLRVHGVLKKYFDVFAVGGIGLL